MEFDFFIPEKILIYLLIFQLIAIFYLLFSIFSHRLLYRFIRTQKGFIRRKILTIFLHCLKEQRFLTQKEVSYLKRHPKLTLYTILRFAKNNRDFSLLELQKNVLEKVLIQFAKRHIHSIFWKNRNFALKVLEIVPNQADEKILLKCLLDKHFLNRKIAAKILIELENEKGIRQILLFIHPNNPFSSFYYPMLFKGHSIKLFDLIYQISNEKQSQNILFACLMILRFSTKQYDMGPLIKQFENHSIIMKKAFITCLKNFKSEHSKQFFIKVSNDESREVQLNAMIALEKYINEDEVFTLFESKLDSEIIGIKNFAAYVLSCSQKGIKILDKHDKTLSKAYANYCHFPREE